MLTRENNLETRGAILRPAARILIEFTAIFNFTSIFNFAYANAPPFNIKDIFADACPFPLCSATAIYCGGLKPRLIKMALSTLLIVFSLSSPMRSLSLRLSSVRICSNKITESFTSPYALLGSSI